MWAWRLGLAVFIVTGVRAVADFADPLAPLPVYVFSGVAALVVAGGWTWWWYAQRRHFVRAADQLGG